MSQYMPRRIVAVEMHQQALRREMGLKQGTHIKFPDTDKGPFIVRKDQLEQEPYKTLLEQFLVKKSEAEQKEQLKINEGGVNESSNESSEG